MTKLKGMAASVNTEKTVSNEETTRPINPKLKKFMEEECKMVKGRFRNYKDSGSVFRFGARKYPGEPVRNYEFIDGQEYTVPLWVARHLNGRDVTAQALNGKIGSCSYPIHGFKWDDGKPAPQSTAGEGGNIVPISGEIKREQRVGFESLEFDTIS